MCGSLQPSEEDGRGTDGTSSNPLDTKAAGSPGESGRGGRSRSSDVGGDGGVGDRGDRSVGRDLWLTITDLGDSGGGSRWRLDLTVTDLRDGSLGRSLRLTVTDLRDRDERSWCLRLTVRDGRDDGSRAGSDGGSHHGRVLRC